MSAAAGAETEASAASDTVYGDSVLGTEVDEERKEGDQGEGVGENDSTRRDTDYEMKDVTTAHKECEDSSTSSTTAAATGEMKAQPPPHIRSMAYDSEDDDSDQRRNLIVNYIPQDMSDEEFSRLFTPFGALLSYKVVRNKSTGHSLEYGFVKFESAAAAERAIRELNGKRVRTKVIKVAHARPQSVELRFANVYVSNLEPTATSEDLRNLFSSYGKVLDIKILTNKETNRSRGVAFVRYEKRTEAENAILSLKGYRSPKISSRGLEVKVIAVTIIATHTLSPSICFFICQCCHCYCLRVLSVCVVCLFVCFYLPLNIQKLHLLRLFCAYADCCK